MEQMPSKQRADARRNYERLLQAAEAVFVEFGVLAPRELIARRAGLGVGTLYRHFPNRLALLEAVYSPRITELATKANELLAQRSPQQALLLWLQMVADYSVKYGGLKEVLDMMAEDKHSPINLAGERLLEAARQAGQLRDDIVVVDLVYLVGGIVQGAQNAKKISEDMLHRMVSVVVDGLTLQRPPRQ